MTVPLVSYYASPLRYPGGKGRMSRWFAALLSENHIKQTYVEPFAGGAGIAVGLLLSNIVEQIVINDLDLGVYAFWHTLVTRPETLIRAIYAVPFDYTTGIGSIGPDAAYNYWLEIHKRYKEGKYHAETARARDFLLLDRMNRSGIVEGGPVGGKSQRGRYNISSRFNKHTLINKIKNLANVRDRIIVTRLEATDLLANLDKFGALQNMLVYADPPYYKQGKNLYHTYAKKRIHELLATRLLDANGWRWVLTYDETSQINELYPSQLCDRYEYRVRYSASQHKRAYEWMYTSPGLVVPSIDKINPLRR